MSRIPGSRLTQISAVAAIVTAVLIFLSLIFWCRAVVNIGDTQWRLRLSDAAAGLSWSSADAWFEEPGLSGEMRDHLPEFMLLPSGESFGAQTQVTVRIDGTGATTLGPFTVRQVVVPLWIPLIVFAIAPFIAWRRSRRHNTGGCAKCGYDLRGLDAPAKCPECGNDVPPPTPPPPPRDR